MGNKQNGATWKIFVQTFKVWSIFFVLIFLLTTFLFLIDSFINSLPPLDIVINVASMVLFFSLCAFLISVFSVFLFLMSGLILRFGKNSLKSGKLEKVIVSANALFTALFSIYLYIETAEYWLVKSFRKSFAIPLSLKILLLSLAGIYLLYFISRGRFAQRIEVEINRFFKIYILIALISFVLISYRVISVSFFNKYKSEPTYTAVQNIKGLPNIILITFDALRAEDMSLYGYHLKTTPNIDEFAGESYVFENMYANSNWTLPSIVSILTGKYPSSHRVNAEMRLLKHDERYSNLAYLLKKDRYNTAAVVDNEYAHPEYNGISDSFDYLPSRDKTTFLLSYGIVKYLDPILIKYEIFLSYIINTILKQQLNIDFELLERPSGHPHPAHYTFKKAQSYIAASETLFFLWVHILPPHGPYMAGTYMFSFLKEKDIFSTIASQTRFFKKYKNNDKNDHSIIKDDILNYRLRYDETILYVDSEFKKFIDGLKASGIYEKSVIIVSSDHGEFFDHGRLGHGEKELYQSVIHIPLIIHLPKQKAGSRIFGNAEHVDIAPTILDLLNMPVPSWMEGNSLKKSMIDGYIKDDPVFSMNLQTNSRFGPVKEGSVAVISGYNKYIYYLKENKGELYNLEKDPKETNNLAETEKGKAEELKNVILQKINIKNNKISTG